MNPIRTIRRLASTLAGLATATLAVITAAPAALATPAPPDPGPAEIVPAPAIHTVVTGGMPGWQITLIAAGAAALAAVLALLFAVLSPRWAAAHNRHYRTSDLAREHYLLDCPPP
jgi:hypothetical protein